jgi:hypothetical protein
MATGLIAAQASTFLTSLASTYRWIQLHVGQPGPAGTANIAAEFGRVQTTWGTPVLATGDARILSTAVTTFLDAIAAEDYAFYSAWSLQTAGACGFTGIITASAVQVGDDFTFPVGALSAVFVTAT